MQMTAIENILPLSPLQKGLLFHAVYDDRGPDVYMVQLAMELEGQLEPHRLRAAAEALVRRHSNLRISIHYEELEQAVQVIPRAVELTWREIDLSVLPDEAQKARRTELLATDQAERFIRQPGR